eukprot:m51a1_g2426 hypothetical protein (510) ;mRNA; r:827405-829198
MPKPPRGAQRCRWRAAAALAFLVVMLYGVQSVLLGPLGPVSGARQPPPADDGAPAKPKLRLFNLSDMSPRRSCLLVPPVSQKFRLELDPVEGAALREAGRAQDAEATLVMLSYRRPENLRVIVDALLESGLFARAVVWNNNVDVELRAECLARREFVPRVAVVNARVNTFTRARFAACAAAPTPVCYSQDDDWDPSPYLYSLYSVFLRDPSALVVATNDLAYATHSQRWSRWNSTYDVHAQHAWLGTGSFIRRQDAVRHLVLTSAFLQEDEALHTDVTFSIWRNAVPTIAQAHLASFGSVAHAAGDSDLAKRTLEAVAISALDYVSDKQTALTLGWTDGSWQFPAVGFSHSPPCEPAPARKFWSLYSHFHAVDESEETVWIPAALCEDAMTPDGDLDAERARQLCRMDRGSHYGLDTLRQRPPGSAIRVIFEHPLSLQMSLKVESSEDGVHWHEAQCQRTCQPGTVPSRNACRYQIDEPYAAVRFVTLGDTEPFRVNDIRPLKAQPQPG